MPLRDMTHNTNSLSAMIGLLALCISTAALLVAINSSSAQPVAIVPTATPIATGAMWSLGTGGTAGQPYFEWVAVYPTSTLWNILGAPSLRFTDHAPYEEGKDRSFEIGFYKYGPTLYTRNHIVEFWIGGSNAGGTLSVIGNEGGGQLEVRNPSDTDHISLDYRKADHPTIKVGKNPLFLRAKEGVYTERTNEGWTNGTIVVPTDAVRAESLILITPITEPRGRWWVHVENPGESFVLHSSALDEDMAFNWLIINQ